MQQWHRHFLNPHPTFQMSFAATLAPDRRCTAPPAIECQTDSSNCAAPALLCGAAAGRARSWHRWSLASRPRLTPHFIFIASRLMRAANLIAMPMVSTVVMPIGLLGPLEYPLRLRPLRSAGDGPRGSSWMNGGRDLGGAPSRLPVGRMPAFGIGPTPLGGPEALLFYLPLPPTPLRWSGAFVATGAIAWAPWRPPSLDILVAGDGQTAAFRGKDGRLAVPCAPGVTSLPSRNGWPPTPMRERLKV